MASEAQRRATKKFEDKTYFKTLVRFKKTDEERIRAAAGDSLNGFIVNCVLNALDGSQNADTSTKAAEPEKLPETPKKPEKKPISLEEAQAMIDQRKAEIERQKRIENGEFMTVAKEEEERYRGKKED